MLFSVEIHEGRITIQYSDKFLIEEKTKQSSQKILFDFIAESVAKFKKKREITEKLPTGFIFPFPVKQERLISGKLIRWTKGYEVTGAVGEDVVQLLKDAFKRRVSIH